ncbi:MAG: hypothetical protein ACD_39C01313G0002 [uncultured bacterium]|nr:MAG: hypothetical protein ACD_39C01313G0002 [uncultured bacterium]
MSQRISRRNAVTLVEILIATSVFSLFMISVFGVFEYSRSGFETGSWRIQRQKHAQTFLLRLKDLLERSNHAYGVAPNGATERVAMRPTVINQEWLNQVASTTNNGIMYFSITSPYVPRQDELGQSERKGKWKGVGLDCKDKTLKLYMTGVWDQMPSHTPADVGSPDLDRFEFGDTQGDFAFTIPDVGAIGVFVAEATQTTDIGRPAVFLTIELLLEHPKSRHPVQITETMTACLVDRTVDEVVSFPSGSFPTP